MGLHFTVILIMGTKPFHIEGFSRTTTTPETQYTRVMEDSMLIFTEGALTNINGDVWLILFQ